MKELWAVSNPNSTNYNFMQEALMAGEVWIAWDHVARVKDALTTQPDQFVAFPAPAGPKGRGYMPVVAGLAIPKDAPNRAGAVAVIEHMTKPETQLMTAAEVGFFPVVKADLPPNLAPGIKLLAGAVAATQGVEGCPRLAAARRPRGQGRRVQQGLHRHLPAHRAAQRAGQDRARRARPRCSRP